MPHGKRKIFFGSTRRAREPSSEPFLHKFYTIIIKKIYTIVVMASILFQPFILNGCRSSVTLYCHIGSFWQFGCKVYTDGRAYTGDKVYTSDRVCTGCISVRTHHKKCIVIAYAYTCGYVLYAHNCDRKRTCGCYLCILSADYVSVVCVYWAIVVVCFVDSVEVVVC